MSRRPGGGSSKAAICAVTYGRTEAPAWPAPEQQERSA
jgi:hypothetical protein